MAGYEVYSDGACSGNPGPGGWGVIILSPDGRRQELSGCEPHTTNNRMELMGVLQGLSAVPSDTAVTVFSDSQYVVNGGRTWLDGWKRKGWKTAGKTEVMNRDLWESIDAERSRLRLSWEWIRGHNGHVLNERADTLARKAILAGTVT
ncbi:MAG TPA: ribonuclease HI [Chloroflexota bacterium]|jgi:ribonuclease HI